MISGVFLCSTDSFIGAFSIQLCGRGRLNRAAVVASFAVCDALASYAGAQFANSAMHWPSTTLFALAAAVSAAAVIRSEMAPRLLWCLPVLFGIDNFFAGPSGIFGAAPSQLAAGVGSAVLATAGVLTAQALTSGTTRISTMLRTLAAVVIGLTLAF